MKSAALCLATVVLALSGAGCALGLGRSLHEYSFLDYTEVRGKSHPVEVEQTQDVVIATGNTDFADQAWRDLLSACPNGRIVNVTAKYATNLGFFGYTNSLKLSGVCLD